MAAARGAVFVGIGLGQHLAFLRHHRIAGQRLGMVEQLGDLRRGQPLGDGDMMLHRLAAPQHREHLAQRRAGREGELGGVDRALAARHLGGDAEIARAADHAGLDAAQAATTSRSPCGTTTLRASGSGPGAV